MSRGFGPGSNTGGSVPSNSGPGGSFGPASYSSTGGSFGPGQNASASASFGPGNSPAKKSGKKSGHDTKKQAVSPRSAKGSSVGPSTAGSYSGAGFGPGRVGAGPPPPSGDNKTGPASPPKKSASPAARAHGPGTSGPPSRVGPPSGSPARVSGPASAHGGSLSGSVPSPVAQRTVPIAPSSPHEEITTSAPVKAPSGRKESEFPPNAPPNFGRNPTFLNGKPNIPFNYAYPCFEEHNGVMFRLVDESAGVWAFYNDSVDFDVTVYMSLGEQSKISPIGGVRLPFSDSKKAYEGRVVIPPRTTVPVLKGTVAEYNLYFKASPLTG